MIAELSTFCGLLFLMVLDWARPWNELVSSSDSSLSGFGVCHAWWPRDIVAKAGRRLERSRFKRCGGHSARASALQAAGFELNAGLWTKRNVAVSKRLAEAGWEVDESFEEIPAAGLRRSLWIPKIWGKWHSSENILILEARTVLKGVKRVLLTRFGHDMRQLVLCDNMSVVLAIERCRAKNFKLLCVIRKIAAFCFARNVHLAIRWIPSELNVSDEPSRLSGPEESKLLVDLVDDVWPDVFLPSQACHAPSKQDTNESAKADSNSSCSPWTCDTNWHKEARAGSSERVQCSNKFRGPFQADQESGRCRFSGEEASGQISGAVLASSHRSPVEESANFEDQAGRHGSRRERQYLVRMRGREQRRQESRRSREAKKMVAEHRVPGNAGAELSADTLGAGFSFKAGAGKLQQETPGTHGFCGEKGFGLQDRPRLCRLCLSELLQPEVCRGRGGSLWGLCSGVLDGSASGVRQVWKSQDTRCLKGWRKLCPARSRMAYPLPVWAQFLGRW